MRPALIFGLGSALLIVLILIHITQGEASLDVRTVYTAVFFPSDHLSHHIVRELRLPRAVMAIFAGGALAVAGVLLQTVTRNPLASASTMGINAGAYLAIVAAAVFAPSLLGSYSLIVALVGGLISFAAVYIMSGKSRSTPVRMALAGMAITMVLAAITGAVQLLYENETSGLFFWGAGSLVLDGWDSVSYAWPWILIGIVVAYVMSRSLELQELGDDMARALGQRVELTRFLGLFIAVLLAAVTVSVVGPIGFVGLVAPHLMRLLGIRRLKMLLAASFLWGAVILVGADVVARLFRNHLGELPVGAVTALIGAPWLVWMVYRSGQLRRAESGQAGISAGGSVKRLSYPVLVVGLMIVLVLSLVLGIILGGLRLDPTQLLAVMMGDGSTLANNIVWNMRLPRMLVAVLAGASLAVSGLLLQGVVRNPLADPSLMSVTSGAGVGALLLIVVWPGLPIGLLPVAAFVGAITAATIVYAFARRDGLDPARLILVGIAMSALGSAVIQILVIQAQMRAAVALAWLAGSTYARSWDDLQQLIMWPLLLLPLGWFVASKLDILALGDDSAAGLGLNKGKARLQAAAIGVALAAAAVATVGTVGFVGLLAPHAARLVVGHRHRLLVPVAALLGAILLVLADLIGRTILAPREIPSGLVVALLGVPYFLWLMRSNKKRLS